MRRLAEILLLLLAVVATSGCRRVFSTQEAVFVSEAGEVYGDSIVVSGKEYRALGPGEITNSWRAGADSSSRSLTYLSGQRMADALFAKALAEDEGVPTATDIYLGEALVNPRRAMESLRSMVSDGRVHRSAWPVTLDCEAWGAAAWEIYCLTGDDEWLKEAYGVIRTTLQTESRLSVSPQGLMRGVPSHLATAPGCFPAWMTSTDFYETCSAAGSAWLYASLDAAGKMARRLGRDSDAELLERGAAKVRGLVNDHFWDPSAASYGAYLYGDFYQILSPMTDTEADALCVLLGIATPEMGEALVAGRPELSRGVPLTFPTVDGRGVFTPRVQAMQGIAAALVRDGGALSRSTGALWLQCVEGQCGALWPALLMRGMLGLRPMADGLAVAPVVPSVFEGDKTLSGLTYRRGTLDLTVRGTGDKVVSISLDGKPLASQVIPADLEGRHAVEVVLAGNTLPDAETRPTRADAVMPEMPKLYWPSDSTLTILNHLPGTVHAIYINGVMNETLEGNSLTVVGTGTRVVATAPVADDGKGPQGFTPRPHVTAPPVNIIRIPATSITPRRAPLHLIRDKETATRYIELAPRHNTRLTFYVQAPVGGDYFINIDYSNGGLETAVRTLEVNGEAAGPLVCLPVVHNDWVRTRRSSTATVRLNAGSNKLSLYYVNSTILLNSINLLKK